MAPTASSRFAPHFSSRLSKEPRFPLGLLLILLALTPAAARAEADVFGLGNGQHGVLQVRNPGVIINTSKPFTAEAPAGSTELRVSDVEGFAAGELVLVIQMRGDLPLEQYAGTGDVLDLKDTGAGRWELARLASVEPGVLRLTAPLVNRFALVSQVVRVPEYTDVRISSSSNSLTAPPWNGLNGGVLAFLVTGTVFNQGTLVADGAGFRGGAAEPGVGSTAVGCEALDGPVGSGGATGGGTSKGEGLASASPGAPTHGYGRLANAGGGGNCHDAGGGGGGHVGKGGQGSRSVLGDGDRDVGGRGGLALRYQAQERLLLGGGGGAGMGGTAGGPGGGIIFLRAREIQGPRPRGFITANGLSAAASTGAGAGGGGAGGTVHVRVERQLGCTGLEAKGGVGGNSDTTPGGGGGGGQLFLQSSGVEAGCIVTAAGGLAGTTPSGNRGAEPVSVPPESGGGVSIINVPFGPPPVPTWVSPGSGEVALPLQPSIQGKTAAGATVQVFLDGTPLGAPVVASDTGDFTVVPATELTRGHHEVRAWAEQLGARSALSAPHGFTVGEIALDVGFGCGVASGGGLGALGLAVLALVLRRRARV